jgi:acetyl esterase
MRAMTKRYTVPAMTDFLVAATPEMIEESLQVNAKLEAMLSTHPVRPEQDVDKVRRFARSGLGWAGPLARSDRASTRTITGPAGPIELRVVSPPSPAGVFLHFHGGGWALGGADEQDLLLEALSDFTNLAAVSVGYRLAPEHPFPAGPDDCECAAQWLVAHAQSEFGTSRLLIGGESAGAHLAALTLLRLRDRHGIIDAFAGANLVFGVHDVAMTPSARSWGTRNLVINTPTMAWFAEMFTPGMTDEERRSPEVSPLYARLHDMPPALFIVGTLDPLLDDSLFMAARWRAAGNDAKLLVFPESVHGFLRFPTAMARAAFEAIFEFVGGVLSPS